MISAQGMVDMADRIRVASAGRLAIRVHSTGEVIPYYEEYKGIREGTLDAAGFAGYQFMPVLGPKTNLIGGSGFPAGPSPIEYLAHFYEGNGMALANELWGDWGVVVGAQGNSGELFAHSNIKLETAADFKGVKFRTAGTWGDILAKYFGAAVVNLPGGEVYTAAEKGVIDAFEYSSAGTNWPMGFHEITKYLGVPGIHSPAGLAFVWVNRERWNELPDDLKQLVKDEAEAMGYRVLTHYNYEDAKAMALYKEYGTEIVVVSDDFQRDIAEKSKEYHMQFYNEDPMFKKIWDDMADFISVFREHAIIVPEYSVFD